MQEVDLVPSGRSARLTRSVNRFLRSRQTMKDVTSKIAQSLKGKDRCHVLVVYEDRETRERATAACDFLVQKFWADIEFEFYWWRMEYLNAPELGERAALNAADADILFFAINDRPVQSSWFDRWLTHREGRPGLLVHLTEMAANPSLAETDMAIFFREVTSRGALDFLSASPHRVEDVLSGAEDSAELRGSDLASGVNDMRRRSTPPSHSGLNE